MSSLRIGDTAPDFTAETTQGPVSFHEWLGDSWGVLFSHPKDFTPVCTTELGALARLEPEFARRGVKVIGLSVDSVDSHRRWSDDIEETQGARPGYPIIGDTRLAVSRLYDMLPATAGESSEGRTPADNQTVRTVYVVGPDKKITLSLSYPMSTGRNFAELLRVIDSMQLTRKHRVSTPADWKQGEDVILSGSVSTEEARTLYPGGWKQPKPYIRIVPAPAPGVHFRKDGVATIDAPVEKMFRYMRAGNHPHQAFKSHRLTGSDGNVVTLEAEVYNPDGSSFTTTIRHVLRAPAGVTTTMTGGPFDGATFELRYTATGTRTRIDLEGEFPALPGMSDADTLQMIDGFLTTVFKEDALTIPHWEN